MSDERFYVAPHFKKWAVYDAAQLRDALPLSVHDSHAKAVAAAIRRNRTA